MYSVPKQALVKLYLDLTSEKGADRLSFDKYYTTELNNISSASSLIPKTLVCYDESTEEFQWYVPTVLENFAYDLKSFVEMDGAGPVMPCAQMGQKERAGKFQFYF